MAAKVNYGFQKSERDRLKKAKKEAKLKEREAAARAKPTATSPGSEAPSTDNERDS